MKITIGIVTCNRPHFCQKLIDSIPVEFRKNIRIANTGIEPFSHPDIPVGNIHRFAYKTAVVFGKNQLMRQFLRDTDSDYLFLLEDDILIADPTVFEKYIKASEVTGIQHLNFGFSQQENLDEQGKPLFKKIVDYPDGVRMVLTHNILGAFSFYTRHCLDTCGIMDEIFSENAMEHVEHTYKVIQKNQHPPFWWFADIYGSWDMIHNQGDATTTLIRDNPSYRGCIMRALANFRKIHNINLLEIFVTNESFVVDKLRMIRNSRPKLPLDNPPETRHSCE